MTRIIHPWIGVVLFFSFCGLFLRFWKLNLWERTDNIWLGRVRDVLTAHDENLPEVGKYSAGQKLVFWSMSFLIIVLITSGIVIWEQYFSEYFSSHAEADCRADTLDRGYHGDLCLDRAGYAPIWVRGTISAMTRGRVTGGWAWRHHRR